MTGANRVRLFYSQDVGAVDSRIADFWKYTGRIPQAVWVAPSVYLAMRIPDEPTIVWRGDAIPVEPSRFLSVNESVIGDRDGEVISGDTWLRLMKENYRDIPEGQRNAVAADNISSDCKLPKLSQSAANDKLGFAEAYTDESGIVRLAHVPGFRVHVE